VQLIGEALGRELTYVDLPYDRAVARFELAMGQFGRWYLDGLADLPERPQPVVQTVAEILGRPGRPSGSGPAARRPVPQPKRQPVTRFGGHHGLG